MKKAPIFVLLTTACLLTISLAKWNRIPGTEKKLVNMSLVNAGTSVSSSEGVSPAGALILGDPIRPINLAGGRSSAVIKFVKQSVVENASFISDGLEGKVSASMSADGKAWNSPASTVFSPADRHITLSFAKAQGRYLRLEFELVRGGTIRSFQAFGDHSDANYKVTQTPDGAGPKINFASGVGGGRLIYINPELYGSRNDAVVMNKLDFPESDEKYRTAVYDLGQVRSLSEFGSVHSPRPVRLAVYAFEALPEKEDWRGRLAFDPQVFDTTQPVASGEDASGSGTIKVKATETVKARYIALRWEPDFNPPSFTVSAPIVSGAANSNFANNGTQVSTTSSGNNVTSNVSDGGQTMEITVNTQSGEQTTSGNVGGGGGSGGNNNSNNNNNNNNNGGNGGNGNPPYSGGNPTGNPNASP